MYMYALNVYTLFAHYLGGSKSSPHNKLITMLKKLFMSKLASAIFSAILAVFLGSIIGPILIQSPQFALFIAHF